MKTIWPIVIFVVTVFVGLSIWLQNETYDPYSVSELDNMLSQDPSWYENKSKENTEDEKLLDKIEDDVPLDALDKDPISVTDGEFNINKSKEEWSKKIYGLFETELGLTEENIQEYERLKNDYDKEKTELKSTGESRVKDLNRLFDKFMEKLREHLGDEGYTSYLELKHNFNKDLLKKQPKMSSPFQIDF